MATRFWHNEVDTVSLVLFWRLINSIFLCGSDGIKIKGPSASRDNLATIIAILSMYMSQYFGYIKVFDCWWDAFAQHLFKNMFKGIYLAYVIILLHMDHNDVIYCQTLVGNKIVDHSGVFGASPVGAAPTTSSFLTWNLAPMDWAKTTAGRDEKHAGLRIWCGLYMRIDGTCELLRFVIV